MKSFSEIFKNVCASENPEVQFRAFYVLRNVTKANRDIATRVVETDLMDILFGITEMKDEGLVNDKVIEKTNL